MISPASSSNSTASITTLRSTPTTRAHTLFDCTPLLLARLPAVDSRKAKPDNGVHPWMLSYSPTEGDEEPIIAGSPCPGSPGGCHRRKGLLSSAPRCDEILVGRRPFADGAPSGRATRVGASTQYLHNYAPA